MARVHDANNRILLRVAVEISDTQKDEIFVSERDLQNSDGPTALAADFCRKHKLDSKKILAPLREHIITNISALSIVDMSRLEIKGSPRPSPRSFFRRSIPQGRPTPIKTTIPPKSNRPPSFIQTHTPNRTLAPPRVTKTPRSIPISTSTPRLSVATPRLSTASGSTSKLSLSRPASRKSRPLPSKASIDLHPSGSEVTDSTMTQDVGESEKSDVPDSGRKGPERVSKNGSGKDLTGSQSARGIREKSRTLQISSANGASRRSGSQSARQRPILRASVFEKLHADAAVKTVKLDLMRADLKAEMEKKNSVTKCKSRSNSAPGLRLYLDAQKRREKFDALRERQEEDNVRREMEEVTWAPKINESQKRVQATPRLLVPSESTKMERMRQEVEEKKMEGCTFQPTIDGRSQALMAHRLRHLNITGSLHEHLYDDAKRREERYQAYQRASREVSPERTDRSSRSCSRLTKKTPSVCDASNKKRRSNPPNTDGAREINGAQARGKSSSEYAALKYKMDGAKHRKYKLIFDVLSRGYDEIPYDVSSADLDADIAQFIRPILQFVKKDRVRLNFDDFCVAMDDAVGSSVTPVTHLFINPVQKKQAVPHAKLDIRRSRSGNEEICEEHASRQQRIRERAEELMKGGTALTGGAPSSMSLANGNASRSTPCLKRASPPVDENANYLYKVNSAEAAVRRCRDVVEKARLSLKI